MRFYGFEQPEILAGTDGMLDLAIDPKLAWALRNRAAFPADVNHADREILLRVPGLGAKTVKRIIETAVIAACGWKMSAFSVRPLRKSGLLSSQTDGLLAVL